MTEPDLEIGDDPMLCHLCDQDIAGSEIVEHLRVEHGGGVSAVSPDAGKDKSSVTTAPQSSVVVPRAMLKRWRKNAFELTEWCYLQRQEGWYVKDCLERGVAKSKRCRVCKLLGEMDALLQDAAPAAATKKDSA